MTDKYDLPFDMTEYTAVRDAFDALPAAQLPDSLSAAALFARMDAQDAAEPPKKASALDIRQLRRGMAIAACGVLVVAAYVSLSQAGMLGGKAASNETVTAQNDAAPAASSAAAAEAAPEEMMLYMAGGSADNGVESAPAEEAPAEDIAADAASDAPASESKEASMTSADTVPESEMLDAANPDTDAPMLTAPQLGYAPDEMPLYADNIPTGYTLLEDAAQGDPEAALLESTGLSFAQLQKAAMTGLDASLELRLNSLSAADNGDGSFALDVQLFALVPTDGADGYAGANLYRLVPAGDGYDLRIGDNLIAHFTA